MTLLTFFGLSYFVGTKFGLMVGRDDPIMNSLMNLYDVEDSTKIKLTSTEMSIPMVILMEGKGNTEDDLIT